MNNKVHYLIFYKYDVPGDKVRGVLNNNNKNKYVYLYIQVTKVNKNSHQIDNGKVPRNLVLRKDCKKTEQAKRKQGIKKSTLTAGHRVYSTTFLLTGRVLGGLI